MKKKLCKRIFLWLLLTVLGIFYFNYYQTAIKPTYDISVLSFSLAYLSRPLAYFGVGGALSTLFCYFSDARPPEKLRTPVMVLVLLLTLLMFLPFLCISGLVPDFLYSPLSTVLVSYTRLPVIFLIPGFLLDFTIASKLGK